MIISPPEKTYRLNGTLQFVALIAPIPAWFTVWLIWKGRPETEPISLISAMALTAVSLWAWTQLRKAALTIHPEGIRRETMVGVAEMSWEEISETRFSQVPLADQMGMHLGLLGWVITAFSGKGKSHSQKTLTLRSLDGRALKITPNWRNADDAIRTVLHRVDPRIKEVFRRRIQNGDTVGFGDVSLSQRGIAWKTNEPIPVNRLATCKIDGTRLRVKAEGKWLDNIHVSTQKVPNIFVLLDLVDELRLGGKAAEPDPLVRATGS